MGRREGFVNARVPKAATGGGRLDPDVVTAVQRSGQAVGDDHVAALHGEEPPRSRVLRGPFSGEAVVPCQLLVPVLPEDTEVREVVVDA
jgi:hypothetical protein